MSIKKLSFILLSALSLAALLNGCGSSSKDGTPGGTARVADEGVCVHCHSTSVDSVSGTQIVADYITSSHNIDAVGCEGCHGGGSQHNGVGPFPYPNPLASDRCIVCHTSGGLASTTQNLAPLFAQAKDKGFVTNNCAHCHTASGVGSIHGAGQQSNKGCVDCHDIAAPNHGADLVNDNNGVRAVTGEFNKWSHHVTGVTLNNAHCAACHLEGKADGGKIVVDTTKHMADNKTHLRNSDTDADFAWDPAAPNFTGMDTFCMSCHDADGATSTGSAAIQAFINTNKINAAGKTAAPLNPFGDTISNQYDKLQRPAVVDAKGQFATTNNSHHAVLGKKYTGRTRTGTTRAVAATFASNSSATLPGARSTIYDAGRFQSLYTTLADATGETGTRNGGTSLGDDSTLHCGDCHTVGQYRAADVGVKPFNNAVIGAHGSNNEYLLRNYAGTDVRHIGQQYDSAGNFVATGPYLVCFNCHIITTYGGTGGTTTATGHDGERAGSEQCNGPYNTRSEPSGISNLVSTLTPVVNDPYTGIGEDRLMSVITRVNGTTAGSFGAQTTGHGGMLGNIYGIQCANCHNSGPKNGFGGIHGSKVQTYTDGLGNTTNARRFLPGLGNVMFVPGTKGGYTGGTAKTYNNYSGNRNGTGTGRTVGQTFALLPVRNVPFSTQTGFKVGSFTYISGGTTNDLNWEQKTSGLDNGSMSTSQGVSGCYTLTTGVTPTINNLQANGYPADDIRYPPSNGMTTYDGRKPLLDNWGGCEDHGGVAGRSSEPFTRGIVRPVSY